MRGFALAVILLAPLGLVALLFVDAFGDEGDEAGSNSAVTSTETLPTAPPVDVVTTPEVAEPPNVVVATVPVVEPCQVPLDAFNGVGFGVPRFAGLIPSVGTVTVGVLFVDFDDVPASQPVQDVFALLDGPAADFYRDNSYGRLEFVLRPQLQWLRLTQPSAHYGASLTDGELHRQFIQEAVTLADPVFDFSTVDLVLVVANPDAESIPFGPVFSSTDPTYGYEADGKVFPTGITSGYDLNFWGGLWLAHELGHTMTLPDLYAFEGEPGLRFTGSFGIMGDIAAPGPGMFAFERWMMGWLDDAQISCHTEGSGVFSLAPIETAGGTKAVLVPMSTTQVLVVESRRRLGFDAGMAEEGALVYVVDSSVWTGEGPLVVAPGIASGPFKEQAPLSPGESFSYSGVTVTVTAAGPEGDTVQVEIGQ